MNRIIEVVAMTVGGLSLFTVCFVGFVALSGKPVHEIALIGKVFPAPQNESKQVEPDVDRAEAPTAKGLSDAAVIEASLGVLSAWTLPSPYSTSELRMLSEELKHKQAELEQRELALARRERAVQEDERELEERLKSLNELRSHLEGLQQEIVGQEQDLARKQSAAAAGEEARWVEVARVIGGLEDPQAGKRLQEYEPAEAAKILSALGDDARAGEILNQVPSQRWKEFVDAYTAEKARGGKRPKR